MLPHFSGWFQQASHWGNASSPSPLNTQLMKGFLCRNSSLSPKNSGPPKMMRLSGSSAFSLAVICSNCPWLNSHAVAAIMSGWCRYISSTTIPVFSFMVADTTSHSTELFVAICACSAGSANEECAYELLRSIQRIFIFHRVAFWG